jgi:homocysteine S-methyltransferase
MPLYRRALPQLSGDLFLTDAGVETDLIFNHGIEIREFAAHTLLPDAAGRIALARYFEGFLALARDMNAGFILDSVTWKAHAHWAEALSASRAELRAANVESIGFIAELRERFTDNPKPIVLNAVMGPRGDAYRPERKIPTGEAEEYFSEQLSWLAATEVDMASALTFNQASEAAGWALAARAAGLPAVVSFTVETDGRLANGQTLADAIAEVDAMSDSHPAYFMINCAHPNHSPGCLKTRRGQGVFAACAPTPPAEAMRSWTKRPNSMREIPANSHFSTAISPTACRGSTCLAGVAVQICATSPKLHVLFVESVEQLSRRPKQLECTPGQGNLERPQTSEIGATFPFARASANGGYPPN